MEIIRNMNIVNYVIGISLVSLCTATGLFGCDARDSTLDTPIDRTTIGESKAIGNDIVLALESYMLSEGHYPQDLSYIVPDYMDAIRPPTAGSRTWLYKAYDDGQTFVLQFGSSIMIYGSSILGYSYDCASREWVSLD